MKFTRAFLSLLLLLTLTFSCTKQDINEEEKLIDDTEIFASDPTGDPVPSGD